MSERERWEEEAEKAWEERRPRRLYSLMEQENNRDRSEYITGYLQACMVREVESSKEIEKLKSLVKRHEEVIREEFGHAITDADEALWKEAK